ncbi:12082_t:CDS:10, partial [Gigaspora rosea]
WPVTTTTTNMSTSNIEVEQELFIERMEELRSDAQHYKKTKTQYTQSEENSQESGEFSEPPTNSQIMLSVIDVQEMEITGPEQAELRTIDTNSHGMTTAIPTQSANLKTLDGTEVPELEIVDEIDRSEVTWKTQDKMIDWMKTESVTTVKSDEGKQRSYSEVVQASTTEKALKKEYIKYLKKRIVQAFGSLEELEALLRHKLETKPMTNTNEVRPQHQKEYQQLYHTAIEKNRQVHNVIMVTNQTNKDQLHSILKKKLMTDHVKSLDMHRKDPHEFTRDLFYRIGFAAIRSHIRFEEKIPDNWIEIPDANVNAEEKFDELPATIKDIRNYMELHDEENKDLFLVTSYKRLPKAREILGQRLTTTGLGPIPPYQMIDEQTVIQDPNGEQSSNTQKYNKDPKYEITKQPMVKSGCENKAEDDIAGDKYDTAGKEPQWYILIQEHCRQWSKNLDTNKLVQNTAMIHKLKSQEKSWYIMTDGTIERISRISASSMSIQHWKYNIKNNKISRCHSCELKNITNRVNCAFKRDISIELYEATEKSTQLTYQCAALQSENKKATRTNPRHDKRGRGTKGANGDNGKD